MGREDIVMEIVTFLYVAMKEEKEETGIKKVAPILKIFIR